VADDLKVGLLGRFNVERSAGRTRIVFGERLDVDFAQTQWSSLTELLRAEAVSAIVLDVSAVSHCDSAGLALLHFLSQGSINPGAKIVIEGLQPKFQRVFDSYKDTSKPLADVPQKPTASEEVGFAAVQVWKDVKDQVAFLGQLAIALPHTLFQPRRMRWPEVARVIEMAGVNALPIVSLISLLVGLIIAFEAAQPLAQFGAQIFIANMMGLLMVREMGPLMTAILLAGRSGSAFAAELGTMKVNEELNALETMGLDPIRFLVAQRITAGIILAPFLTVFSMLMGIFGGVLVMLALGFPLSAVLAQLADTLTVKDVVVGALKGTVFGALVSAVGCLRGLQTKKGPAAVGDSTTRAVVASILLIILTDALFSVIIYALDL
jgi:phospholipid/cholesterol/gamma-HCH transport system permease protein